MTAAHKLVGYAKKSGQLSAEYEVQQPTFGVVCHVAGIPYDDRDATGRYPLSPLAAQEIGKIIGAEIDTDRLDYFLQPALFEGP